MWRIVLEWLKEYAEVIGLVLTIVGGVYSFCGAVGIIVCVVLLGLAALVYSLYKVFKELRSQIETLQQELRRKDEALRQAEAKSQEDSRLIEELRSQIETLQQDLQCRDEALSQSVAKAHEDSRLIEELRSQIEARQKEFQHIKDLHTQLEQMRTELHSKDDALSTAQTQRAEEAKERAEFQRQLKAEREDKERIKKEEALKRKEIQKQLEEKQLELQQVQSEAKSQEASRRIEELRSQVEAYQQVLQRKDKALRQAEAKINKLQQVSEQEKSKKKVPLMSDSDFLELCQYGDTKKVEQTILNGVNVNATRTYDGRTALMLAAAFSKNPEVIKILVNAGADIHAEDNYGRTALRWAKIYGNTETADLLRRYGAN